MEVVNAPRTSAGVHISEEHPDLDYRRVSFSASETTVRGVLAAPKGADARPAVIVIHENRGLMEHIKDVARRTALEGYVALGVDLMSPLGGSDSFPTRDDAIANIRNVTPHQVLQQLDASVDFLKSQPNVRADRIGVIGFCWGGGASLLFATRRPDLAAAVSFYGRSPDPLDNVQNIRAPVMCVYGEDDPGLMPGVPALEEALKRHGKAHEVYVYAGAKHAFHNDDNHERWDPQAARSAWARTVLFFQRHLSA
ncbi:MAG: dienelactone hydrolase family protein [Chloroflexi bacterium]|nr:dienelactone hydrolase family protein [Chloroflexota bacterium]